MMNKTSNMKYPGLAVVISSPSGAGKTTICKRLVKNNADFQFSISATTRAPRKNEKNGVDYLFVSKDQFLQSRKNDEFIETARYLGNYYGTPLQPLRKAIGQGNVVLLDIDIQGGKSIKKLLPDAVTIFIVPPGVQSLRRRLTGRSTEDAPTIRKRLETARKELRFWKKYDYIVINDNLNDALNQIQAILQAERLKTNRLKDKSYWKKSLSDLLGLTGTSR